MTASRNYRCRSASLGAVFLAGALTLSSCKSTTDSLLDVEDPDLISQEKINSAEGALALRDGALSRFRNITGGAESSWLFGGLLADEWSTSSTFVQNDETTEGTAIHQESPGRVRLETANIIPTDPRRGGNATTRCPAGLLF